MKRKRWIENYLNIDGLVADFNPWRGHEADLLLVARATANVNLAVIESRAKLPNLDVTFFSLGGLALHGSACYGVVAH